MHEFDRLSRYFDFEPNCTFRDLAAASRLQPPRTLPDLQFRLKQRQLLDFFFVQQLGKHLHGRTSQLLALLGFSMIVTPPYAARAS